MSRKSTKLNFKLALLLALGIIFSFNQNIFSQESPLVAKKKNVIFYSALLLQQNSIISAEVQKGIKAEDEFAAGWKKKSPAQAFFMSLVLPGTGQIYSGAEAKGKIFLSAEALCWESFWLFRSLGNQKGENYGNFAATPASGNDGYYSNSSFYGSSDEYPRFTRLHNIPSEIIYPEDGFSNWQWDNADSRLQYRNLKNQNKIFYRLSLYSIGMAVFTRIVSSFDAALSAKKFNQKRSVEQGGWGFHPKIGISNAKLNWKLVCQKSF